MDNYWYDQQSSWWGNPNNRGYYYHSVNDIRLDRVMVGTNTPVTLDDIKLHLNLEEPSWDSYCTSLVMSATAYCERYTGRSIFGSTWDQFQQRFDKKNKLYYPRLDSITFLKYYDNTGTQQTLDNTTYYVQGLTESLGILWFDQFRTIPQQQRDNPLCVNIRYTTVPFTDADLMHAIRLICGEWFMQRANVAELQLWPTSTNVKNLLDPLKIGGYA